MRNYRLLGRLTAAIVLLSPLAAAAQSSNSETYRQLNLFGDVFERVRSDYVEEVSDQQLIEAAINGAKDELLGLKENVIIGKLIPAGTGAEARALQARARELTPEEAEAIREREQARAFLSGDDADADGDGTVDTAEAEAAAADEAETVAELMGAGDNAEIEATVEEETFGADEEELGLDDIEQDIGEE